MILRLPDLQVLDATGAQALGEIVGSSKRAASRCSSRARDPSTCGCSRRSGSLDRLAHERHLFDDLDAAVAHAREHVARRRRIEGGWWQRHASAAAWGLSALGGTRTPNLLIRRRSRRVRLLLSNPL